MSRKKHHEGHGGAWKVAYADFVTAMMALFMVLWISAQQKEILIATSKYFQSPFTSPMPASSGVINNKKERPMIEQNGVDSKAFTAEMYMAMAQEFLKMLDVNDSSKKDRPIDIGVAAEGITLSLFNRDNQPFFEPGTNKITTWGDYACQNLAWIIDRYRLRVRVEAHLAKDVLTATEDRDSWDLTTEQANVVRRRLVHYGLESSKIDRIIGFGDSKPRRDTVATDSSNSRVELILSATPDTPPPTHTIQK